MALPADFWTSFVGPTAGALGVIAITGAWNRITRRVKQPERTAADLLSFKEEISASFKTVTTKVDDLAASYVKKDENDRISEQTMLRVQDLQFGVMSDLTGAVREIGRSVCNGNKEKAMSLCDDADKKIEKGQGLQTDYLIAK